MIAVDERGVLREPFDLHDADFKSMAMDNGSLRLIAISEDGVQWTLVLPKVRAISINTFIGEGNNIFEVLIFSKRLPELEIESKIDTSYLDGKVAEEIAEGRMLAFHLIPCYGAEMTALSTATMDEITLERA